MPPLDERPRMEAKLPLTAASNKPAPFQENAIINIILQSLEIHIAKKALRWNLKQVSVSHNI